MMIRVRHYARFIILTVVLLFTTFYLFLRQDDLQETLNILNPNIGNTGAGLDLLMNINSNGDAKKHHSTGDSGHGPQLEIGGVEPTLGKSRGPALNTQGIMESNVEEGEGEAGVAKSDKIVVMASLQSEDTTWVADQLPDWQRAIYVVDNASAPLHTPLNKGNEAMAYLTYIIDNYPNFPSTIAFLHSHWKGCGPSWHTDTFRCDNARSLNLLQIPYVQKEGYVNLRCQWNPGCSDVLKPFHTPHDPEKIQEPYVEAAWKFMFRDEAKVPELIGVACCSQFAVSNKQVLKRKKEEYQKYRTWLLETWHTDAVSGRVFEYFWHVIFGKDAVHCPNERQCRCDVYGKCNNSGPS